MKQKIGVLTLAACGALAGPLPGGHPGQQYRSVLRTDANGYLVRRMIVTTAAPASALAAGPIRTNAAVSEIIEQTASKYDVDPLLVHSVIQVESAYDAKAVSPKGAQGLMQLIPATARRFGVSDSFDVRQNIEAGVKYLKYLNSLFPNDLRLTLAAYNAGEGAVWKYGNNVPPYRETKQYVEKVGQRYGLARKKAAPEKKEPSKQQLAATEPRYRPIESFIDSDGRLHMRTAPDPAP